MRMSRLISPIPHPIPPIMFVISCIMARELYRPWFIMQIGMILGFVTIYLTNWLLVKWAVKGGM